MMVYLVGQFMWKERESECGFTAVHWHGVTGWLARQRFGKKKIGISVLSLIDFLKTENFKTSSIFIQWSSE